MMYEAAPGQHCTLCV